MKRLRVLHVCKTYLPAMGGIEQVVSQITTGLKDKITFFILTTRDFSDKGKERINGIFIRRSLALCKIFSMPIALFYPFWFWAYARKVDIVDYHYPFPLIDFLITVYFPKTTKLVIHFHSEIIAQKNIAKFLMPFFNHSLKRADKIVVAAQSFITNSEKLKSYESKCEVIPFGIDAHFWKTILPQEQQHILQLKQQYGKFILAVGRLVPYKGFDILLKAISNNMKVVIIGTGPLEQKLKQIAAHLNIEAQVYFLGYQSTQALKCYLHACYLFVFSSVSENEAFGMVQLEAMACQKPIINTLLKSAVPEVARNAHEAISVKPRDSLALRQAINQLLNNEQQARLLGENGFNRVQAVYSKEQFIHKTYFLYQNIWAHL